VGGERTNVLNDQLPVTRDLEVTTDETKALSVMVAENWIAGPRSLNQFSVQVLNWWNNLDSNARPPVTQNLHFPSVFIGRPCCSGVYQLNHQNKIQLQDTFTTELGKHAIRFGGDYWRDVVGPGGLIDFGGVAQVYGALYFFDDPSTILSNTVKYPQGFQTPGIVRQFAQTSSIGNFEPGPNGKPQQLAAWVQDDWRPVTRLTLNLGLRYDVSLNYYNQSEAAANRTYLALAAIGNPFGGGVPHNDLRDVSPRLGFAYEWGEGKTVLRGGYGLYYDQNYITYQFQQYMQMKATPLITTTLTNTAIGVGDLATYRLGIDPPPIGSGPVTQLPRGGRTVGYWYDPALRDPYNHQVHIGVSHVLTPTTTLTADYTLALQRNYNWNEDINPLQNGTRVLAPALQQTFGDPNLLSDVNIWRDVLSSRYNELAVQVQRRVGRATFQGSYTLSKSEGYSGQAVIYNQPFALGEWGPTNLDERHKVVVSGVFPLPGDFQVAPVFQAASARPYTLTAGTDLNGDGRANDRYIDPATGQAVAAFSQRGDPFSLLDVRATKKFALNKGHVEVFAEFFNVFNKANFGNNYNGNALSALFKQPTGLMRDVGYPRQMQLGTRYVF
jgi:hypothetical protein